MSEITFDDFMGRQIERIEQYKQRLEKERGESLTLDEAARNWVRQQAESFRENYTESRGSSSP
ncbi:MAG: hypothetical protein ABEK50_08675 [bacterium]